MSSPYISIGRLYRRFSGTTNTEEHVFLPGVNILVGRKGTGKTTWLRTIDYLLGGDTDDNPYEDSEKPWLNDKYDAAGCELRVGKHTYHIERRWRERNAKTKIFIDGVSHSTDEFQIFLMKNLDIPHLSFPKGNPMSGQTWTSLSFRILLRHIYRRQLLWTNLADKQPETEQHASLLQFLGIADRLYTEHYEEYIRLRIQSDALKAERGQFDNTLKRIAQEVLSDPELSVGVNAQAVRNAQVRLETKLESLRNLRIATITQARDEAFSPADRSQIDQLAQERVDVAAKLSDFRERTQALEKRIEEVSYYRNELQSELERIARAEDASVVLADLKVTHCPACDQSVSDVAPDPDQCFLCHQLLPEDPVIEGLGAVRLRFEQDRLKAELQESDQLLNVFQREEQHLRIHIRETEEQLCLVENKLSPTREAVAALIQEEVSVIDMQMGELHERQRQLGRISEAVKYGFSLTRQIEDLEREIEPLKEEVDSTVRSTDFDAVAEALADGMNAYMSAINLLKENVWPHNPISLDITRSGFKFRIGSKNWSKVLGGSDTLFFLMSYHYGLMSLSDKIGMHYPGFVLIDIPPYFAGEAVQDKENFIVQPFIELLKQNEYLGTQMIITGSSFENLHGVQRIELDQVYVA